MYLKLKGCLLMTQFLCLIQLFYHILETHLIYILSYVYFNSYCYASLIWQYIITFFLRCVIHVVCIWMWDCAKAAVSDYVFAIFLVSMRSLFVSLIQDISIFKDRIACGRATIASVVFKGPSIVEAIFRSLRPLLTPFWYLLTRLMSAFSFRHD